MDTSPGQVTVVETTRLEGMREHFIFYSKNIRGEKRWGKIEKTSDGHDDNYSCFSSTKFK